MKNWKKKIKIKIKKMTNIENIIQNWIFILPKCSESKNKASYENHYFLKDLVFYLNEF